MTSFVRWATEAAASLPSTVIHVRAMDRLYRPKRQEGSCPSCTIRARPRRSCPLETSMWTCSTPCSTPSVACAGRAGGNSRSRSARSSRGTGLSPIAASTLSGMRGKRVIEGDGVLQALRWLNRTPESFVPGHVPAANEALPHVDPDRILRFDAIAIYQALDAQRIARGLSWSQVAREIGGIAPRWADEARERRARRLSGSHEGFPLAWAAGRQLHPRGVTIGRWPFPRARV